jgi:terminase large subunit-like protein
MGLALNLARALDPIELARDVGLVPDRWQVEALRSRHRQSVLNCARQSGKSTVSAIRAVHTALYRAPALVLLLAPALRQSQELFRKVRDVLAALGEEVPPYDQDTSLSLELATGSRIVCLPSKEATIRGFSAVALLIVDEAARVPDPLFAAVRPMLAVSAGQLMLLSTPYGQRGFFWEVFTAGGVDWHRARVTAQECPRISPAWLAEERRALPDRVFRQEYECSFELTEDQVFGPDLVMRAVTSAVRPLFGGGRREG